MDGRVDGVKLDAIDAKPKDAGAHVAEARHLEAGDERRPVVLRCVCVCVASFSRDFLSQLV